MWQLTIYTANHSFDVCVDLATAGRVEAEVQRYWTGGQNGTCHIRIGGERAVGDCREYILVLPLNEIQAIALEQVLKG